MAKQIIWSPLAKEALKDLLISSQERDGNKRCGGTLYTLFQNALYRVTLNPFIGQPTEAENIRYIIPHPDYTLLYRHSLRKIEVLVLWNNHHKLGSMINIIREEPDTSSVHIAGTNHVSVPNISSVYPRHTICQR
jgi:plasmid stabilization system protein ParE